jgi:hypothetical protein
MSFIEPERRFGMRRHGFLAGAILALLLATTGSTATADSGRGQGRRLKADIKGFEEIPTLSTTGHGEFDARIANDEASVDYTLSYADLEADVLQAHIHLGAPAFNGGIMVFLCTNLGNGPPGTPLCPAAGGTVEGTFEAADVVGPAAQGVSAGEFAEAIQAMRAGAAYVNVHTVKYPGGEIRGQIND